MKKSLKLTGIAIIVMAIIFSMTAIACDEDDGGGKIAVTGVSLDILSANIPVDGTETLTATVAPANATNKAVKWSSDDLSVAAVSSNGKVTALSTGSATIIVSTVDGGYIASCKVTVRDSSVAVKGVSLNLDTLSLGVGGTETLIASIEPVDATNQKVTWSSDKPAVATVANGTVTAVAAGTAVITVITEDGEYSADCDVTVSTPVAVTSVTLDKTSATINVGGTERLTETVSPPDATNKNVTWSSSATPVARVSNSGTVTGVSAGSATITVTTADGGKTATCTITVISTSVPVTGVTLNKSSSSIIVGGTDTLSATVAPTNATNKNVTWSSSNTTVARVSNGTVTAVSAGSTVITVTTVDGGKTATCNVTVNAAVPVTGVTLDKTILNLAKGAKATLTATVSPTNATIKTVTWSSDKPAVATVANGVVTGVAGGTAIITVTTVDGGKTATCDVTIPPTPVTGVTLDKTAAGILVGRSETLTATVVPDDATDKTVTWSIIPTTGIVNVSQSGVVTGVAAGTAVITVTTKDGGKTATFTATVSATEFPATSVSLNKSVLIFDKEGTTETLTVSFVPDDKVTNKNVTWSSSNTKVATVSSSGVVTGVGPGKAVITATAYSVSPASGAKDTCAVTVPITAATLGMYLATLPSNSPTTSPHPIPPADMPALKISASDFGLINAALRGESSKYVNLDISESVITSISSSAFSGCTSLVEIKMPDGVTSIGNNAFNGCTNLKTINVPSAVTSIGYNAFTGTAWLKDKPDGLVYFGNAVLITYKGTMAADTNITTINNDTKVIADRAFYNFNNLTSVTIPASVTNIGISAFQGCTGITAITIPNAVTSIGNSAFSGCTGLTTITIPNTVTSIGNSAFSGCTKLDSVTFQGTMPSAGFSSSAFPGDLRTKFYAPVTPNGPPTISGTPGTYTRASGGTEWTKH